LAARIAQAVRAEAVAEPLPGLHLHRASHPHERIHSIAKPAFCVIAQGRKEMCVGEIGYRYDAEHYLLTTVDLPFTGGRQRFLHFVLGARACCTKTGSLPRY